MLTGLTGLLGATAAPLVAAESNVKFDVALTECQAITDVRAVTSKYNAAI